MLTPVSPSGAELWTGWRQLPIKGIGAEGLGSSRRYFNASLISVSRFITSVKSSDNLTPFCSALTEKHARTVRAIAASKKTLAPGGRW
jgi:hypothetical protein